METKEAIVQDWPVRYTGRPLESFTPYILLGNFTSYLHYLRKRFEVEIVGRETPMPSASYRDTTLISF